MTSKAEIIARIMANCSDALTVEIDEGRGSIRAHVRLPWRWLFIKPDARSRVCDDVERVLERAAPAHIWVRSTVFWVRLLWWRVVVR